jgi:hypothetical protein
VVNVFAQFSLPQISVVARRTALSALGLGVAALVGTGLAGYGLVGFGMCVGLAMALGNFRLISRATIKQAASDRENKRRPLALNTLGRLGVITGVAFGLVFLSHQVGFGAIVGLALFQFTLLANVILAMLRAGQAAAGADGGSVES